MPYYHTNPTHGVQCADGIAADRAQKRVGIARLAPPDSFGEPAPCAHPALSNASLARWPRWRLLPIVPALVISASSSCFRRVQKMTRTVQIEAEWVPAVFASNNITQLDSTLEDEHDDDARSCRSTSYDGATAAHRAAWARIVQRNVSMAILEEDAEPVGDAADVRASIDRCEATECDIQYLGTTGEVFFGAFAYYVTPRAAAYLLRVATRSRCNLNKPDKAIRYACLGAGLVHCLSRTYHAGQPRCDVANLTRASPPALRCLKPARVLWVRELEGLGVFNMNHRELPNHVVASHGVAALHEKQKDDDDAAAHAAGAVAAQRERMCTLMLAPGYRRPPPGKGG